MVLRTPFVAVALRLQEASDMMHSDVASRLRDTVADKHRGTGTWASYIDHNGDGESGDCIYSCDGDIRKAPYEIQSQGGKQVANIDTESSTNVVPRTTYEEEADDDDNYASMMEAGLYTKGPIPLCERFISKKERDSMDKADFAGKGNSFPINQPGDIMAAVHSMGRAGDKNVGASTLKSRIIAIAKRKGWTKYLPKSWQGGGDSTSSSEADVSRGTGSLRLFESAQTLETIVLKEAKADYEIKLIAPGAGSTAYYPKEVLERDGPKVFKAGTHVYLNHPTAAEEAARPEGDVKNLAGVLSSNAVYHESHAKGPGLYARMKVFQDHAQTVEEKAPHVGMSIRASGVAESGKTREGRPVLKELTSAESVDVVTRAGAGGMILTESANAGNSQEVDMTEAEVTRLIESRTAAITAPLHARALRGDAMVEANRVLFPLSLHEAAKQEIITRVLEKPEAFPLTEGALDTKKFEELVMAEARRVAALLGVVAPATVRGLGIGAPVEIDPKVAAKEAKRQRKLLEAEEEGAVDVFQRLGMPEDAAKIAAKGRAA
jgi:hypothetical protein